jgi:hypothetical protein
MAANQPRGQQFKLRDDALTSEMPSMRRLYEENPGACEFFARAETSDSRREKNKQKLLGDSPGPPVPAELRPEPAFS